MENEPVQSKNGPSSEQLLATTISVFISEENKQYTFLWRLKVVAKKYENEARNSKIFKWVWVVSAAVAAIAPHLTQSWTIAIEVSALLVCLLNIIFVCLMYYLDRGLQITNGLLSYIDWDNLEDTPPYTSISVCTSIFIFVIVTVIALTEIVPANTVAPVLLEVTFLLSLFGIIASIIQLNMFDGLLFNPNLSRTNRRQIRIMAWSMYIAIMFLVIFLCMIIAAFYFPVVSIVSGLLFAISMSSYYHVMTPSECRVANSEEESLGFYKLRAKLYKGKIESPNGIEKDEYDDNAVAIILRYKADVVGGMRVIVGELQLGELPMFKDGFDPSGIGFFRGFGSKKVAEFSRAVVEPVFQGSDALSRLVDEGKNIALNNGAEYIFCVSTRAHARRYRRLGFEVVEGITVPYTEPGTGREFVISKLELQTG